MSTCAVVRLEDGLVINIIVADPVNDIPPDGCELIELIESQPGHDGGIGWIWDGTQFIPPPEA